MNRVSANMDLIKMYVIQSKNEIIMNVRVSVKEQMIGFLLNDNMWNPSTCDCECTKACKIDEYLDIKNWSCAKRLIGKLVLEFEYEILNTTEAFDKKVTCEKSNYMFALINR